MYELTDEEICWDRALVLWKKNLPGRCLTKVEKHWARLYFSILHLLRNDSGVHLASDLIVTWGLEALLLGEKRPADVANHHIVSS